MKIGVIGLGRMGRGIAGRVLGAGHDLAVYNRTSGKDADLVAAGARSVASIALACEQRDVVVTMLADDAALDAVALGAGGVRDSLPVGAIHMVMGTHGVGIVRALTAAHAAAGQTLVAAPVLGRPDAAASGQLGIVAAGPAEALQRCKPLLDVIGRRTFEAGASPDAATSIKLANNFMLGCAVQAMGEAYSLVRRFGVAPQVLHDVMTEGLFSAPAYKVYGKIMADEAYDNVGFTTRLALKDMSLVLAAGDMARVPLPSASLLRDRLLAAIAHGDADRDWAVLAREQARTAGLE
ncbi:MAG: NAD(P)-dependent oxidoreductase [Burkholderiales bacterium]|jgi:3-hydroxyisobutyrate dehydrogenase-like beta-hydroxyacid dehydrogenase|nr:NAD(P)-dependent oxidoreductase [Burkholderiales bacterium]MBP8006888.1 NAD(P)-dependent oxidoreductase [Burkholderiales bacterium]